MEHIISYTKYYICINLYKNHLAQQLFNIMGVIRNALYKTFVFQIVKKFNQPQKQQKTDLETSWIFYEQF